MDNYESITRAENSIYSAGTSLPARDVLNAVVINWMVRFDALRSNSHSLFSFFSQPLY